MAVEIKEVLNDFDMVEFHISDPEVNKITYVISNENMNWPFWSVKLSKGKVPSELSSMFTKSVLAEEAVLHYLSKQKPSKTLRRDQYTEEREARKEG